MRSTFTHILAALAGLGIALVFAMPSSRTIPPDPPPMAVRDRLPVDPAETRVSPPAAPVTDKQAMPCRVIPIDVDDSANEVTWCRALQVVIGGEAEQSVTHGRVDNLADEFAIEVDWLSKWHQGIGQALHYSHATGRPPVLALALKGKDGVYEGDHTKCAYIAQVCAEQGIAVWVLHVERKQ